jgi:glutathione S-transferase
MQPSHEEAAMKLYYFESANPRKVCALAKHLDLPLEYVLLDASKGEHKSPAHLARNPNGRVPVLIDGATSLWESAAIMVYLAGKARSDMWPSDALKQADVMRWITWDAYEFMPHGGSFYFECLIKQRFGLGEPDRAELEAQTGPLRQSAQVLDGYLADRKFLVGDTLTIADFCVGVLLPWADEIELPIKDYANIQRWHDGLMQLDAWRNPWPAR